MKLFNKACEAKREVINIDPKTLTQLEILLCGKLDKLSFTELKDHNPDNLQYTSELETILEKHGNARNWLKRVEGKNIALSERNDRGDLKTYFCRVDRGEIKPDTFEGLINETPFIKKFMGKDGKTFKISKREMIDMDGKSFHLLRNILKEELGNLDIEQLKLHPKYKTEYVSLVTIFEKNGNANNWLKNVEGKNISLYDSDGGYSSKTYFFHVDGGEIKPHTFEGLISEKWRTRKFMGKDGKTFNQAYTWEKELEIPKLSPK